MLVKNVLMIRLLTSNGGNYVLLHEAMDYFICEAGELKSQDPDKVRLH